MHADARNDADLALSKSCSTQAESGVRLATRVLYEFDGLRVVSTRWRRHEHPPASTAETGTAVVELLDRGNFVRQSAAGRECVDRNAIAFFNPEERFRIEHPLGVENAGVWIEIEERWWTSAARELGLVARDPRRPFRRTAAVSTFAADRARRRLVERSNQRCRGEPSGEPLGVEEALFEVLVGALEAHDEALTSQRRDRLPPAGWAARVAAARAFLAENHRRRLRLTDVATAVGGSRYALCRAFAASTGRSIHRHLVSLRLRSALDEIEHGCRDLTALALRCGFASHAHFTTSFRRAYGVTPSHARAERLRR